jgi:hypothetical protein
MPVSIKDALTALLSYELHNGIMHSLGGVWGGLCRDRLSHCHKTLTSCAKGPHMTVSKSPEVTLIVDSARVEQRDSVSSSPFDHD